MPIPKSSKIELIRLWEEGVPLDSAWETFALGLDPFAIAALRIHPDDDLKIHGLYNRDYKELISRELLPRTLEGRKKTLEIITENERTHLLRDIYAGRLWAIGFETLPSGSVEPIRVPQELFDAGDPERRRNIDWSNRAINVGSGLVRDIRIVPAPRTSDVLMAPRSAATENSHDNVNAVATQTTAHVTQSPRGGRPRTDEEIRNKVRQLWTDPAFHALPNRLEQAREVRAQLKGPQARHVDTMQGYGSAKIQRIIGEVATEKRRSARN